LKTNKVVSKGRQFTNLQGIDATPSPFFKDSPVFAKDEATDSYIKSCQTTWFGDSAQQTYINNLTTAALVSDAINAYEGKHFKEALDLYAKAAGAPGGFQLRVLNGIYLTNLKLNKRAEAEGAFGNMIEFGLESNRVAVKFLFPKNSAKYQAASDAP